MKDANDLHQAGELEEAQKKNVVPFNKRAKDEAAKKGPRVYSVKELLAESVKRAADKELLTKCCTTGHYLLDDYTLGFQPESAWVISADTGFGKSSFLVSFADENIRAGKRVLIVSAEDPSTVYADRLLVRRANVNADRFRKKCLKQDEMDRVIAVADKGEDVPVYMSADMRPIEELEPHIRRIIKAESIDIVAFDYLGEFQSNKTFQSERLRVNHIAATMRNIHRTLGISGAIFTQVTVTDATKPPTKHSVKDSRDVANAAEIVLLGFMPKINIEDNAGHVIMEAGRRYMLLDKNTSGPAGKIIPMDWNDDLACFNTVLDPARAFDPDCATNGLL